jgi:hypothetical protein
MIKYDRQALPVIPANVAFPGCLACGTCCNGANVPLWPNELKLLDEGGTTFTIHRGPNARQMTLEDGRVFYQMVGWCAFNEHNDNPSRFGCKLFGKPERPAICTEYIEAGPNCRYMQVAHQVITEEHLQQPGAEAYLEELLEYSTVAEFVTDEQNR